MTSHKLESLCAVGRKFYARGWMLATAGNLSVRLSATPLRYAVTASGGHKGQLTTADFIEFGAGMSNPGDSRKPSAETVVHDRLYASVDCGAILHVHGPHMTLVARHWHAAGRVDVSGFEYIKALGFWEPRAQVSLPVVQNHHALDALADAVCAARSSAPVVLVESHGVYAWGATVADAQRHIEATEFLCQMVWMEATAGRRPWP